MIAAYVVEQESEDGGILFRLGDGTPYIRLGSGRIISLGRHGAGNGIFASYLEDMYGLNCHEPAAKFVYDQIRAKAVWEGDSVELRRFAKFDTKTRQLYLSQYNGSMWRLDGDSVESLPNGEDECFFADDDGGSACEDDVDIGAHGVLLPTLSNLSFVKDTASGMGPEVQQRIFVAWMFALAFPDLQPTKPMLLLEGQQGSGKTSGCVSVQLVLTGRRKPVQLRKGQEDEFGIMLLRSPICCLDNADSFIDWLPDALCSYATAGQWVRRKLYTDDEEINIRPQSFIAIATRIPASFRRGDTAERCLVLRLEPLRTKIPQGQLEARLLGLRPKLLGEYLYYANKIVEVIRSGFLDEIRNEKLRMADFAAFARVVGIVLGWTDAEIEEMFDAIQLESAALTEETDPLTEVLSAWLGYQSRDGRYSNVGRKVTLNALYSELKSFAQSLGVEDWYDKPRILRDRLKGPNLSRNFRIESAPNPINTSQHLYMIWRATDPKLTLVDDAFTDRVVIDLSEGT